MHCTDAITALGSDIIIAAFYVNSSTFPTEKRAATARRYVTSERARIAAPGTRSTSPDPFNVNRSGGKKAEGLRAFSSPFLRLTPELLFAHSISGSNLVQRQGSLLGRQRQGGEKERVKWQARETDSLLETETRVNKEGISDIAHQGRMVGSLSKCKANSLPFFKHFRSLQT